MITMAVMNTNTVNGMTISRTGRSVFSAKLTALFCLALHRGTDTRGFSPVNETEELFHQARCMSWTAASSLSSRFIY